MDVAGAKALGLPVSSHVHRSISPLVSCGVDSDGRMLLVSVYDDCDGIFVSSLDAGSMERLQGRQGIRGWESMNSTQRIDVAMRRCARLSIAGVPHASRLLLEDDEISLPATPRGEAWFGIPKDEPIAACGIYVSGAWLICRVYEASGAITLRAFDPVLVKEYEAKTDKATIASIFKVDMESITIDKKTAVMKSICSLAALSSSGDFFLDFAAQGFLI